VTKEDAQKDIFVIRASRIEEILHQERLDDDPGGGARDDDVVPVLRQPVWRLGCGTPDQRRATDTQQLQTVDDQAEGVHQTHVKLVITRI